MNSELSKSICQILSGYNCKVQWDFIQQTEKSREDYSFMIYLENNNVNLWIRSVSICAHTVSLVNVFPWCSLKTQHKQTLTSRKTIASALLIHNVAAKNGSWRLSQLMRGVSHWSSDQQPELNGGGNKDRVSVFFLSEWWAVCEASKSFSLFPKTD